MTRFNEFPFFLNDEAVRWADETYAAMSTEERIGQLFFPLCLSPDPAYLEYEILSKHPGGVLFRSGDCGDIKQAHSYLQSHSKIPLLTAANLESGGTGIVNQGTFFANQMAIAATDDAENAYKLGKICAREGKAVGVNYAFAPVVDIDINYHNPITNVRTYGSDKEKIAAFAGNYIKACSEENVLTSIKHFPGDGVDERDQHIAMTVNSLSRDEWMNSYGCIYKSLIDGGVLSVMVGHISLPAYQDKEKYMPASLSKELVTGLLRETLQFKGLVITDATPMVGFTSAMERKKAVYTAIMAGCDMFLFNKDYNEDYHFMLQAYKQGDLTEERLEEAVKKILAVKAKLQLHKNDNLPPRDGEKVLNNSEFKAWSRRVCAQAVTLVKDTQKLLPINSRQYKRVLYQILGDCDSNKRVCDCFVKKMTEYGYTMIPYERETFDFFKPLVFDNAETFRNKYDLVIYIGNIENSSNKTTNRINWYTLFGLGNNMPWFVNEVPTMFISLQNPYHLLDAPMMKTYINCYQNNNTMIETVVDKINGCGDFTGISPVDAFMGREELKL